MALTAYDIAALKETKFQKGIVQMFIRESDPIKVLPIENIDTMSVQTRRIQTLPTVAWRKRGERFADGGQPGYEIVTDSLYNIGSEINIDDADMKDKGPYIQNPIAFNTEARVMAMKYDFADKLINGDHASDEDAFEGIKKRIAGLASAQTLYAASEVDIRPSAVTAATAYTFLNRVDEAKANLDGNGGGTVVCFTDGDFIRSFKNALRVLGQYTGPVGKPVTTISERDTSNEPYTGTMWEWDGVTYIDMGVKADQSTKIVATETISNACRPAYFVRLGSPKYLHLIQYGPMDIEEPTRLDDKVTYRGVISWYVGLRHVHNRFAVKLSGTRVA